MSVDPSLFASSTHFLALALDAIDYGMVVLDPHGDVLHANLRARVELRAHRTLALAGRRLTAHRDCDSAALNSALRAASRRGLRRLLEIEDADGRMDVAVMPLPSPAPEDPAAALIVLGRRQLCEDLSIQSFASDHKLTPAETCVLRALCAGESTGAYARRRGVALSTVRSQISSLRAKTKTPSVRDLVRRVAGLPPIVSALRLC